MVVPDWRAEVLAHLKSQLDDLDDQYLQFLQKRCQLAGKIAQLEREAQNGQAKSGDHRLGGSS